MNKRKLLLSFCFSLMLGNAAIVNVASANVEQRRAELIKVLDEELREVTRLNKQLNSSRPDLMLRMGQILLEKARLLKDRENQVYLETPAAERSKKNRDSYFTESRRYFDQAQKTVLVLLKRFKNFPEKADAYYILAYNAKELRKDEESKKYFQLALKSSKKDNVIADKSRIALGEMYFNQGYFDKALPLYEQALKNKRDKWWTKDAFNLAWCYFKTGKTDRAISLMNESYSLSKSSQYIDMSSSIERDLALFYAEAGRTNEAVTFYQKNGKSVSDVMLKVGRYLKGQGKFSAAEKTLNDALKYKTTSKEEVEIHIELINLYERFGREQRHYETSKFLTTEFSKGNLDKEQTEILKFNVEKISALLQKQIVDKTYQSQPKIRQQKADRAHEYFMMSAIVSPDKAQLAYMHAGETYFAMGQADRAVPLYAEAIKKAQANNDKKTESAASNSLMAALGGKVSKATVDTYLIPAYEGFLSVNPRGDKSSAIYQRLFSEQMGRKNVAEAEKVLVNFKTNFPRESLVQEKMLAQIMDHHRASGNKAALSSWAQKIESKEFQVNPTYAANVKSLMLGMQFEKVEEANSKGDKKAALRGYLEIFKSPETDNEAKKTAAYNIAVLFYDTGMWKQMHQWADRAVTMMTPAEVNKFDKDFIHFTTDLFQRRQFAESASLSEKVFDKTCKTKSNNLRVHFKNANVIYLADREFDKSLALMNRASNCGLPNDVILPGYVDHLNELAAANRWGSFNEVIKKLETSKEMWPALIYPSSLLANELEVIGRADDADKVRKKMMTYFDVSKKSKQRIPLEGLDAIALIRLESLETQMKRFNAIELKFPESEFNKNLKTKFQMLDRITTEAISIAELGSGIGIVKAYRYTVEAHENLRDQVLNVVPDGKSEEYVTSFKGSMQKLIAPISKQAEDFRKTAIGQIEKENILSSDNAWFLVKNDGVIPEYHSDIGSALMDKAGVR